jgi:uncharacterized protein (TIGR00299 family) protein
MRIAYFDCFSGASGDMLVGALVDAGAGEEALRREVGKLGLEGVELSFRDVKKCGIRAKKFDVRCSDDTVGPARGLSDIVALIEGSGICAAAKANAVRVFNRLAEAEARVHGVAAAEVHFHEVGAVDSIVDIVGVCVALELLGVEKIYSSAMALGRGEIQVAHGKLPLPAPATVELLKGKPVRQTGMRGELTTPTGAAVLSTLAARFGEMPEMGISNIGYGAGERELEGQPNVLRVFIGEDVEEAERDWVWEVQTNIDDVSPEVCGYLMERLLGVGALDVFVTPVLMKKSRPGQLVTVLARPESVSDVERVIFEETTTLGTRRKRAERRKLHREEVTVKTCYGEVRGKIASLGERVLFFSPEYESAKAVAIGAGVPLREVMEEAKAAFRRHQREEDPG